MRRKERFGQAIAVVGLQYGSEGKGGITAYLATIATAVVRIGAANAGHTVYFCGKPYVMRQAPCGWVNPLTLLYIGVGAVISLPVLLEEIERIDAVLPIRHRLRIDPRAQVITDDEIAQEQELGLADRIGSTSGRSALGIGAAVVDKVSRSDKCRKAQDVPELQPFLADTSEELYRLLEDDQIVLFEGTQGFGLSIEHGTFPYVTSMDTTTSALFAKAGVTPYAFDTQVVGVARTYPIRVGGNSGPFDPDSVELSWEQVAYRAGADRDITEMTSVTGLARRVATFSRKGFRRACLINQPTEIALTFADYIDWTIHGQERISLPVRAFIESIEQETGADVMLVKTGPNTIIDRDRDRSRIFRKIG